MLWPFITVERAELEAFKIAIDFILEHHCSNVIIEGDTQTVVDALCGRTVRGLHSQVLVNNIRELASSCFGISFRFCFREANGVAQRLARRDLSGFSANVWFDGGPIWISDLVLSDLSD